VKPVDEWREEDMRIRGLSKALLYLYKVVESYNNG
jgi:hypothetical protein